jgi:hypothetical protein
MADTAQVGPEEVERWLAQYLTPKTRLVQEAMLWLKSFLKKPYSVSIMCNILLNGHTEQTRQAAGILLRAWLAKHWGRVDEDVAIVMKDALLNAFAVEPSAPLRRAMAGLICLVARLTLPLDHWPEFWPAIFQMAHSEDEGLRESVLGVLEEIGDKLFEDMRPHVPDLLAFCEACMGADQRPEIRFAALKAVGVLVGEVQEESDELVEAFKPLVGPMLDIANMCVMEGAEMEAREAISIFQGMIRLCPAILAPQVLNLMQFCLLHAGNVEVDWEVRRECLAFIEDVVALKPSFVNRNGLLDPILTVAFNIAAEPQVEGLSSWDITPFRYSLQIIDVIARHIKPKRCFENIIGRVDAWMGSHNPWERRAAVGALSACPTGCIEVMLPQLDKFIPYLEAAFDDPDAFVRQTGCILLGQMADELNPDIVEYHETCLPLAYRALMEPNIEVQERALYSLMAFMEHLNPQQLEDVLEPLMTRLVDILQNSNNKETQEMTLETIAAVAAASVDSFEPYWEPIVKMLQQMMEITESEHLSLRAQALKTAGVIAMGVGKEHFMPYFDFFMHKALECFNDSRVETTQMREFSINFFGDVAESLGEDFAPYFDTALQIILTSLQNVDGARPELGEENAHMAALMLNSDDEEDGAGLPPADAEDAEIDDEDRLPPELDSLKYITNMGLVDEKTTALQALGSIIHAMGALFVPHIETCLPILALTARYVHPKVRCFTVFPLESLVVAMNRAYPPERPWVEGESVNPEEHPLHPQTQAFCDEMLSLFAKRILTDIELSVANRYLEALKIIMNTLGAPALHHLLPTVVGPAVVQAIELKTMAHGMATEEADDESEMIAQELLALFDTSCDFVIALAKHYRANFAQWFSLIETIIVHLATESTDESFTPWRQEAMGALAEVCEAATLDAFTPAQVHIFLAQAISGMQEETNVRSNALYLARQIVTSSASYDWWPVMLPILVPLLTIEDDQTADNAAGCVASMINTNPSLLPMADLLPEFLSTFPIRIDQIEAGIAYGTLMNMLDHSSQDIFPHIPTAFKVLVDAMASPVLSEETRARVQTTIKSLWSQFSNDLQPVLETLDEEGSNNLQVVLNTE